MDITSVYWGYIVAVFMGALLNQENCLWVHCTRTMTGFKISYPFLLGYDGGTSISLAAEIRPKHIARSLLL